VDVLFFELEISNVLIKSFVWHICHEDIFTVAPRTVWPAVTWAEIDWVELASLNSFAKRTVIALPLPGLNLMLFGLPNDAKLSF